jgi:hypothetical protein
MKVSTEAFSSPSPQNDASWPVPRLIHATFSTLSIAWFAVFGVSRT